MDLTCPWCRRRRSWTCRPWPFRWRCQCNPSDESCRSSAGTCCDPFQLEESWTNLRPRVRSFHRLQHQVQTCPQARRQAQTCPQVLLHVQICPQVLHLVQICPQVQRRVRTFLLVQHSPLAPPFPRLSGLNQLKNQEGKLEQKYFIIRRESSTNSTLMLQVWMPNWNNSHYLHKNAFKTINKGSQKTQKLLNIIKGAPSLVPRFGKAWQLPWVPFGRHPSAK